MADPVIPQDAIAQAVANELARREHHNNVHRTVENGRKEIPDFDEKSAVFMALGGQERPELIFAVAHHPAGHKIVDHLYDDPDTLVKLAKMPLPAMTAEVKKLGNKLTNPPAQQPKAGGQAHTKQVDTFDPKLPIREYMEARNQAARQRTRKG